MGSNMTVGTQESVLRQRQPSAGWHFWPNAQHATLCRGVQRIILTLIPRPTLNLTLLTLLTLTLFERLAKKFYPIIPICSVRYVRVEITRLTALYWRRETPSQGRILYVHGGDSVTGMLRFGGQTAASQRDGVCRTQPFVVVRQK